MLVSANVSHPLPEGHCVQSASLTQMEPRRCRCAPGLTAVSSAGSILPRGAVIAKSVLYRERKEHAQPGHRMLIPPEEESPACPEVQKENQLQRWRTGTIRPDEMIRGG